MEASGKPTGSALRDKIAGLLQCVYSDVEVEKGLAITTADVFYIDDSNQLIQNRVAIECKDWKRGLSSSNIAEIYTLYKPSLDSGEIDRLLIIGKKELSQQPSRAVSTLRDVAYVSFERFVFSLMNFNYVLQDNIAAYQNHDSAKNFIHSYVKGQTNTLEEVAIEWLESSENILLTYGGYGIGKTSFSLYFCQFMTNRYRLGEFDRIPIRITLGDLFTKQDLKGVICSCLTGAEGRAAVRNFSYNLFIQMNREGYFLLILDGFDEMRHAMTLDDFKFTFEDMALLFEGKSKTIVLGRPDSFFSEEEEDEIIDSILHNVFGDLQRIRKIEVNLLNPTQVSAYLDQVLMRRSDDPNIEALKRFKDRAITDEMDILSRPVQLNMFATLMNSFAYTSKKFGRYDLYFEFIYRFVLRENAKPSRKFAIEPSDNVEIGYSDPRTIFMQNLAWWLFTEKKENRFRANEVPQEIIPQSIRQSLGVDAALREVIVGSVVENVDESKTNVIETKGAKVYYFPHKSYIEFLVAEYFCRAQFSKDMFRTFFRFANREILSFIAEAPPQAVANIRIGLEYARGTVSLEVVEIAARDPAIEREESVWSSGNLAPGRLYVYYHYLTTELRGDESIEAFIFVNLTKANTFVRVAAVYAMLGDYLGQERREGLFEKVLAFVLSEVGEYKLMELAKGGVEIFAEDRKAAHILFLASCAVVEGRTISVDIQRLKQFSLDACRKGLFVREFDIAPAAGAGIYSRKVDDIRGLPDGVKRVLLELPLKTRHTFRAQMRGGEM